MSAAPSCVSWQAPEYPLDTRAGPSAARAPDDRPRRSVNMYCSCDVSTVFPPPSDPQGAYHHSQVVHNVGNVDVRLTTDRVRGRTAEAQTVMADTRIEDGGAVLTDDAGEAEAGSHRARASTSAGKDLAQVAMIPAGLEAFGFDPAPGRGFVLLERQQQPCALRVSGAHSIRDDSRSRRPLDALVGQRRHALRPISSRTPTSRCRFATADHPGPARGSRQGAGRAAIGTRAAKSSHHRLREQLHAPP